MSVWPDRAAVGSGVPQTWALEVQKGFAVTAAAYGVLKALFPNRSAVVQAAYEQRLAALPDNAAKTLGLALGSEVAAEAVRLRANDGSNVALAPYVSGTAAGQFRAANPNPVFRHFPSIKPFALESLSQPGPWPRRR